MRIGDRVRLTVGGSPLIVRIVGRAIEPDLDGEVLSVGLDSLAAKDSVPPEFYALALQPGRRPGRGGGQAAGRIGRERWTCRRWSTRPTGWRSSGW